MFFALGFLGATLLALVTLSAVWHRAVRLTTKRIEGAIPVSMTEIQADKDQLRAEFAMSTRRLENSVEQLKLKTSEQLAEIGRKGEAVRLLKQEVEEKTARVTALEAQERTLRDKLNSTEEELSAKSRMLHDAEAALAAKEKEIADAGRRLSALATESGSARSRSQRCRPSARRSKAVSRRWSARLQKPKRVWRRSATSPRGPRIRSGRNEKRSRN